MVDVVILTFDQVYTRLVIEKFPLLQGLNNVEFVTIGDGFEIGEPLTFTVGVTV